MFAYTSILAVLILLAGCGTALNSAVRKGDINGVKALLDQDADANETSFGNTPLVWASKEKHIEIVKLLLDGGADVNAVAGMGWTALSEAAFHAETDIVNLLIDRGADINKAIRVMGDWSGFQNARELLREIKRERVASQPVTHPSPQSLTKEDLANIVKSLVEDDKKVSK